MGDAMIHVVANMRRSEKAAGGRMIAELWVIGHAGAADKGKDVVCAAVSALVLSFVNWLHKKAGERKDVWSCITDIESGLADIYCSAETDKDILSAAFEMTVDGLECIAKEYPEYVTIEERNAHD